MVTNEQRNKLGRYEKGLSFANFAILDNENVYYSWGMVGFEASNGREISITDMETDVRMLVSDGYVRVDETPISEGNNKDADILLDWVGGITR